MIEQHSLCMMGSLIFGTRIRMLASVTVSGNKLAASVCMTINGFCQVNTLVAC